MFVLDVKGTFDWFDKNCDGKINVSELGLALRLEGMNPTAAEIKDMIAVVDTTGKLILFLKTLLYIKPKQMMKA